MAQENSTILVAVIDSGLDYDKLNEDQKEYLYHNDYDTIGDGIDNDNNGYVDDYRGIQTGSEENGFNLDVIGGSNHGTSMAKHIIDRVTDAQNNFSETNLDVSVMMGSSNRWYSDTIAALNYGAKIINLSLGFKESHSSYLENIADIAHANDALVFIWWRARGDGEDLGVVNGSDHIIELGFVDDTYTYGEGDADLIAAEGKNSNGIAKTSGDIAAIWATDPSLSSQEVLDIAAQTTTSYEGELAKESEMGGVLDRDAAIQMILDNNKDDGSEKEPILYDMREGYVHASNDGDVIGFGSERADINNFDGADQFKMFGINEEKAHRIRSFGDDDTLDISDVIDGFDSLTDSISDFVSLREVSWNGSTHTFLSIDTEGQADYHDGVFLKEASGLNIDDMIESGQLVIL